MKKNGCEEEEYAEKSRPERENCPVAERQFGVGTVEGSFGAGQLNVSQEVTVGCPGVVSVNKHEEKYRNSRFTCGGKTFSVS